MNKKSLKEELQKKSTILKKNTKMNHPIVMNKVKSNSVMDKKAPSSTLSSNLNTHFDKKPNSHNNNQNHQMHLQKGKELFQLTKENSVVTNLKK